MSGILSRLPFAPTLNGTGSAGPRRLAIIILILAGIGGAIVAVTSIQPHEEPASAPGPLPHVNLLPGGIHSNPQQDALGVIDNQDKAARAEETGASFTPVMPSSRAYSDPKPLHPSTALKPVTAPVVVPAPVVHAAAGPDPAPKLVVASPPTRFPAALPKPPAAIITVAQTSQRPPQEDAALKAALDRMMATWGGRPPRTDVVIPPDDTAGARPDAEATPARRSVSGESQSPAQPVSASPVSSAAGRQDVLVPAGRGIYAHTILAANSDAQSPVILQADTGPLSGDRMIGSFARERTRLVIRISKVIHHNQEIGCDGIVVAPATMEVGVASRVDQNYLERFALPAAAAFVQGLGQAIAQSNSTSVLGPLGTVTAQNKLNFDQQLGIGAGVAAAQLGAELQQSTPHGPTVILDVGSSVGVLFLTNVSANN